MTGNLALRDGKAVRVRRRGRSGAWSARFQLPAGSGAQELLEQIEQMVIGMGRAGGLESDEAYFVGVALHEAVQNALQHGRNPNRPPARVGLHLRPGSIEITVRDCGPGFDPSRVPDPCADENLLRGGGRGIFFMRCFTDRVSFTFPRAGGTVVRLSKKTRG
jgi:serine/threonine-protein kinase RsbW